MPRRSTPPPSASQMTPIADHHQHLFSPALAALYSGSLPAITAEEVVGLLDAAGISLALVLSGAYLYGRATRTAEDEYARVRAENDWTGAQAAQYPDRLRACWSVNPLREYALDELARCASAPNLSRGVKLHFGNSDIQLDDPAHVAQLRRVFEAANEHGMAMVVHLRASISKQRAYGAAQAGVFLEELLSAAPDVPVQVAHLAGTGPGYDDPPADTAMGVLAEAVERGDPRTDRLWFDVATIAPPAMRPPNAALAARRIRQAGVERTLYGSDAAAGDNPRPREGWAAFRRLPLDDDEFARIAGNVAPHLL